MMKMVVKSMLLLPVARADHSLDVSPHVKVAFNIYLQRITSMYEIFENDVYDVFVKDLHIAK